MTMTGYVATLMNVFAASLTVVGPSGLITASRSHGEGLSIGWIVVLVLAVLIVAVVLLRRRPEPDEEELQAQQRDDLEKRLGPLPDSDCRRMCFWLASSPQPYQQALYEAMEGTNRDESSAYGGGAPPPG
jgi:hypothetical protein